jgi:hypothetical protein
MAKEFLNEIRKRLKKQSVDRTVTSKIETWQARYDIRDKAIKLHSELGSLSEILNYPEIGGKLDLGTDPDQISWDKMPEGLAGCFRPEFDFQPDEISGFSVRSSEDSSTGSRGLDFRMERNKFPWSSVTVDVYNRRDYKSGSVDAHCQSKHGQVKKARDAMDELEDRMWHAGSENVDSSFRYGINSLNYVNDIMNYVGFEISKRLPKDDNK